MTHRVYVRWPDQRATDKTSTESEAVAQTAFDELLRRPDLAGQGAAAAWTVDGQQRAYHQLDGVGEGPIPPALRRIFEGIAALHAAYPHRTFTIDGKLVGDLGEVIAALAYDLELGEVNQHNHDAVTPDGRQVQIKASFGDASLTFKTVPDYYLGIKLHRDGRFEEVFNGPGHVIHQHYAHRQGIGVNLLSFPMAQLRALSAGVAPADRIPLRAAAAA